MLANRGAEGTPSDPQKSVQSIDSTRISDASPMPPV
jgi:hypothetical protein